MTTIAQTIVEGRRAMAASEVAIVQDLLAQYGIAWRHVEARLTEVEGLIEAAIARGDVVDDAWLRRQVWWDGTLRSIEREMSRYTARMAQTLAQGQMGGIATASQASSAISQYIATEAAKRGISIGGVIQPGVNPGMMERWVVAQQPGSPVREAIDRYGDRVSQSIRVNMTEGLAAGEHPRTITRKVMQEVGPDAVEGRIHTITRTENHRAYRGALRDSMEAMGPTVLQGWRWLAGLGPRCCVACMAMHGREFPFEEYPDRFHVACRCTISPVPRADIIPPRQHQTGEEWLRKEPADVQRRVLRSEDRYQAFVNEGYSLNDFTGITRDPVWGESVRVKPMREVRAV